ncbi:MAG: hypothetical protein PW791_09250 [Neorhizobium sp.]|nr:hypothetical protein [Neorhizobium sp.]
MTTTTSTLVSNTPSATVLVESEVNADLGAVRPASAAHLYNPSGEVSDINPLGVKLPSGQETPIYLLSTGSGTTSATAVSITIANIGSSSGAVAGSTLPAGAAVTWRASPGKTLAGINYDASGTTLIISGTQNG